MYLVSYVSFLPTVKFVHNLSKGPIVKLKYMFENIRGYIKLTIKKKRMSPLKVIFCIPLDMHPSHHEQFRSI